ncbi:MAG: winged helix-turn-helix transcriptional regulator [Pseudoramibacter sp.]
MAKIKNHYPCSLMLEHDLLGGKWKLRILYHILIGDNRFSSLRRTIPDITEKVLISQLKEMQAFGLLTRTEYGTKPPKTVIYAMSDQYPELKDFVDAACKFSLHYAGDHGILISDDDNGNPIIG